jgi:phage-related protein
MKELIWVGSSLKDLKKFPSEVMGEIGYALHEVQKGLKPKNAKPMTGFVPSVMEIVSDFDKNTYRAIYTIKIGGNVYVLHTFQKKSKQGVSTPMQEVDLIRRRLKEAIQLSEHEEINL